MLRRDLAPERLDAVRKERRRADDDRGRADERERLHERARDPRMEDVSDDCDVEPFEPSERAVHGVQVEQSLGRMLVLPVARVHDVRARVPRDEPGSADRGVADDDHVGVVGGERERRVLQRLALVHGRAGRSERHRVRREALGSELEARERARGGLVEEVHDGSPAQRRELLQLAVERGGQRFGGLEDPLDVRALEVGDREEVATRRRRAPGAQTSRPSSPPSRSSTRSTSSTSRSSTWIRSPRAVGRFFPT